MDEFTVATMAFKQPEVVSDVLPVASHHLSNVFVNVLAATIAKDLPKKEEPSSAFGILDLNDDCLCEIFRLLSPPDLLFIADTCSRFRFNAEKAVARSHGDIDLSTWSPAKRNTLDMQQISRFLKKFGSNLTGISCQFIFLDKGKNSERMISLISEYCDKSLKSLRLSKFAIERSSAPKFQAVFANMNILDLKNCSLKLPIGTQLLPSLSKLTRFTLNGSTNITLEAFTLVQSKLEYLYLGESALDNVTQVENFLRNQSQLRELVLYTECYEKIKSKRVLNAVAEFCAGLRKLTLHGMYINESMVSTMRTLFAKLESLAFDSCALYKCPGLFSECKSLHTLQVRRVPNFLEIAAANDFPMLEDLSIDDIVAQASATAFLTDRKQMKKFKFLLFNLNGSEHKSIAKSMGQWQLENVQVVEYQDEIYECTVTPIPLTKMTNIRKLEIYNNNIGENDSTLFIDGIVSIDTLTHLDLFNVVVDNRLINAISRLRKLSYLSLVNHEDGTIIPINPLKLVGLAKLDQLAVLKLKGHWTIVDSDVVGLVTHLLKLRKLTLILFNFGYYNAYNRIVEIVNSRNQPLILLTNETNRKTKCYFNYLRMERNVPKTV